MTYVGGSSPSVMSHPPHFARQYDFPALIKAKRAVSTSVGRRIATAGSASMINCRISSARGHGSEIVRRRRLAALSTRFCETGANIQNGPNWSTLACHALSSSAALVQCSRTWSSSNRVRMRTSVRSMSETCSAMVAAFSSADRRSFGSSPSTDKTRLRIVACSTELGGSPADSGIELLPRAPASATDNRYMDPVVQTEIAPITNNQGEQFVSLAAEFWPTGRTAPSTRCPTSMAPDPCGGGRADRMPIPLRSVGPIHSSRSVSHGC